jgi:hypothetical protein
MVHPLLMAGPSVPQRSSSVRDSQQISSVRSKEDRVNRAVWRLNSRRLFCLLEPHLTETVRRGSGNMVVLALSVHFTCSEGNDYDRRPVCHSILMSSRHVPMTRFFVAFRELSVSWCGTPYLTRKRVCSLQLLSPAQSYITPMNSISHFSSLVLLQFLWCLYSVLLSLPTHAKSQSSERFSVAVMF